MVLVRFPPRHPFSIVMEGGRSQGGVVTPSGVTSEQQVCDLIDDAAVISNKVTITTDLSVPVLFSQIIHQIVGTVQIQDGLAFIGGGGDQDFVADGHGWLPLVDSVIIRAGWGHGNPLWTLIRPSQGRLPSQWQVVR